MNERRPDGRGNRLYLLVLPTPSARPPPHYLCPLSLRLAHSLSLLPLLRRSLPHSSLLQTCISSPHRSFFLPPLSAASPIPPPTTRADGWILFFRTSSSRPGRKMSSRAIILLHVYTTQSKVEKIKSLLLFGAITVQKYC